MIILNEYEWAENALIDKQLGKRPLETINRVIKYYLYKGYSKEDAGRMTENFILQCNPTTSLIGWKDVVTRGIKDAEKYPLKIIDEIAVTDTEINTINNIEGVQLQRVAFTLLCVAKYLNICNPNNESWVYIPDGEIFKMANVSTSVKRQCELFSKLRNLGLIRFATRVDNLSVQVLFVNDGNKAMSITDFRNLGHQYLMFKGAPYYKCENCGIVTKISHPENGRPPKYCKECAIKIRMQQRVESVMRTRNK